VAVELLVHETLDDTEVETIADIAAGVADVTRGSRAVSAFSKKGGA
jgi:hypothetical protein